MTFIPCGTPRGLSEVAIDMHMNRLRKLLLSLLIWSSVLGVCLFATQVALAANKSVPLPAEQAFAFSAVLKNPHEIVAKWQVANGYYLYRDRIRVNVMPGTVTAIQFPKGQARHNLEHGQYEVYAGKLTLPIQFQTDAQQVQLMVDYQGCSKNGFCYPPIHKVVSMTVAHSLSSSTPTNVPISSLMTNQNNVAAVLSSDRIGLTLLLFLGIGLLLAFTPCVLPMVPILTGLIVGQQKSVTTKKAFLLSLTYVMGMALTYALAGMMVAAMGNSLQVWLQKPIILVLASVLFFLLALSLFGLYHLQLPRQLGNRISHWSNRQQGGTYPGVFIMGVLSTLVVSPCVTAPLVGVLIYIAQTGDKLFGAAVLFTMGIGMGIPLLLIGVSAGKWLPKRGPWMEVIKKIFGILMLGVSIWLMSRIVSSMVSMVLWGLLLAGTVFFLGVYLPDVVGKRKFHRGLAFAAGVFGLIVMGGEIGVVDMVRHWTGSVQVESGGPSFIVVRSMQALDSQLAQAKAANQPVMLDFYADWCESCVVMDKTVFSQMDVQRAMAGFVRVRVDLTANSMSDEAIMKRFHVIAPPTMLFFNVDGQEINDKRIVGELSARELLDRINVFLAQGCDWKAQC